MVYNIIIIPLFYNCIFMHKFNIFILWFAFPKLLVASAHRIEGCELEVSGLFKDSSVYRDFVLDVTHSKPNVQVAPQSWATLLVQQVRSVLAVAEFQVVEGLLQGERRWEANPRPSGRGFCPSPTSRSLELLLFSSSHSSEAHACSEQQPPEAR